VSFCPKNAIRAKLGNRLFQPRYVAEGISASDIIPPSQGKKRTPSAVP
jgi:hypothetical protein